MNRATRFVTLGVVALGAAYAISQQTSTSSSNSQTQQGSGSATASASSSGRATASSSQGGQVGGGLQGGGQQSGANAARAIGSGSGQAGALPNYALMLNRLPNPARAIDRELWAQETQYWSRLANAGIVTMAGNWREYDGCLVLFHANDDNGARQIAENDPAVRQGAFNYVLRAWEVKVVGAGTTSVSGERLAPARAGGGGAVGGVGGGR